MIAAVAAESAGLRAVMATFPTGVTVVTTKDPGGRPFGMTCSSLCCVTLEPPTVLVCLNSQSPTLAALLRTGSFAVNLLHHRARAAAQLFSSGRPDRFDHVRWHDGLGGPHLIDDSHAVLHCGLGGTEAVGDHAVVFGEVACLWQQARNSRRPLLYGLRRYEAWPRRLPPARQCRGDRISDGGRGQYLKPFPLPVGIDFKENVAVILGLDEVDRGVRETERMNQLKQCVPEPLRKLNHLVTKRGSHGTPVNHGTRVRLRVDRDRKYLRASYYNAYIVFLGNQLLKEARGMLHGREGAPVARVHLRG